MTGIDTLNTTQNTRLTTIEGYNVSTRLTALENYDIALDARLDDLELDIDGGTP